MLLTLAGWTSPQIAEAFGVREDTVRFWRSEFAGGGVVGIIDGLGQLNSWGVLEQWVNAWHSTNTLLPMTMHVGEVLSHDVRDEDDVQLGHQRGDLGDERMTKGDVAVVGFDSAWTDHPRKPGAICAALYRGGACVRFCRGPLLHPGGHWRWIALVVARKA